MMHGQQNIKHTLLVFFAMPILLSPVLQNFTLVSAAFTHLSKLLLPAVTIWHHVFTPPSPACYATRTPNRFSTPPVIFLPNLPIPIRTCPP
jgi:hypothetical protein